MATWKLVKGHTADRSPLTLNCRICGAVYETTNCREYARYSSSRRRGVPNLAGTCETCWRQAQQSKTRDVLKEKYGVENASLIPGVDDKKRETCKRNHGADYPQQAASVRTRSAAQVRARYGRDNVFQGPDGVALAQQGMQQAYGRTNIFAGPQGVEVARQGLLKKFGVTSALAAPGALQRHRATMLAHHGVTNPLFIPSVIARARAANAQRRASPEYRKELLEMWSVRLKDRLPEGWAFEAPELGETHFDVICPTCDAHWKVHRSNPWALLPAERKHCPSCKPMSFIEERLASFLPHAAWLRKNRSVLSPEAMRAVGLPGVHNGLELDYFCPEKRIAVEVNGLYFHSEAVLLRNHPTWGPGEARRFHWFKWAACAAQGIRLITLWETEVTSRVAPFFRNLLGQEGEVVGARELKLDPGVPHGEATSFYEEHHLQGGCNGTTHVGLRDDTDRLRAVMTFGNAQNCRSSADATLLQRFATHGRIPGAASRLLTRAPPGRDIISYSDNRYSNGALYSRLGFELTRSAGPDYSYVKGPRLIPKASCQRTALIAEATAAQEDTSGSEAALAARLGYLRVWDCGKKTWLLRR
jgi:hypothetical protein